MKFIYKCSFLPFKYLYKFVIFAFFLTYLSTGGQSAWILLKSSLVNLQHINALHYIIEKNVRNDSLKFITKWVRYRPLSETDAIIEIITPKSGDMEPGLFFEISSRRIRQEDVRDALFWAQLGLYRIRYDALRCGSLDAPEVFDEIFSAFFVSYQIRDLMKINPELVKESIHQVMDFDAKYPASNSPSVTCDIFKKLKSSGASIASEDQWKRLRRNLRMVTEAFLERPEEK